MQDRISLSALRPDPQNANKGTKHGQHLLRRSVRELGAGRSVLVDRHGTIIAGNQATESLLEEGYGEAILVETDGSTPVVVRRSGLDLSKGGRARELAYVDNRSSELNLNWRLEQLLADFDGGFDFENAGFTSQQLAALFNRLPETHGDLDAPPRIDEADELRKKYGVEPGQVWAAGKHRIMCTDATDSENVAALFADETPRLMVTDPPYGVEYDAEWRKDVGLNEGGRTRKVANDDRADWTEAWKVFPGTVAYVWHAGVHAATVHTSIEMAGFNIRSQIIWQKTSFAISRGHYHWRHEPCWYAVRKGKSAHWIGDRAQSTVWDIPHDENVVGGHSTQKPRECMQRAIRNHEGDVYDPFIGSGTTLVAAENEGRTCYAIDIDPAYVAVCLQRLEDIGLNPRLLIA